MENTPSGSLNPADLATLSLLNGYNRFGGGGVGVGGGMGGYGGIGTLPYGNNVLAAEAHANGTATKEAIDKNGDFVKLGFSAQSNRFEDATRERQFTTIVAGQTEAERRVTDSIASSLAIVNDHRAENAKGQCELAAKLAECCCKNQLGIAELGKEIVLSEGRLSTQMLNQTIAEQDGKIRAAEGAANTQQLLSAITSIGPAIVGALAPLLNNSNGNGHGH